MTDIYKEQFFLVILHNSGSFEGCEENFVKEGCFKDKMRLRPLPILLLNYRNQLEDKWNDWDNFIKRWEKNNQVNIALLYRYFKMVLFSGGPSTSFPVTRVTVVMNRYVLWPKTIARTNQKGRRNPQIEETRVRTIHDWFWFYA